MKRIGWLAAATLVAMAGTVWTEPVKNTWAKFKPGTTIKIKNSTSGSIGSMKFEENSTITSTLKEVTESEVVITKITEVTRMMNGQVQKQKPLETWPHYPIMAEPPPEPEGEVVETGEEELTISSRKFKCKWTQRIQNVEENQVTSKTWTSDDMPGGLVKLEMSSEGKHKRVMRGEVFEVDIKE